MEKEKDFFPADSDLLSIDTDEYVEALEHVLALLKETKESTRRANQAKSAFLANISHEIRTPMTAIMGFAQMLKYTHLDETQRDHVDVILESGAKLLSFINDLLELSNLELGKVEVKLLPCDPSQLLQQVWSEYLPRITEKDLIAELIFPQDLPEIETDPRMLHRVLDSILENAVKFTDHGSISMECDIDSIPGEGEKLRICVSDTGIGIAQERVHSIFNLFEQADNSVTRRYGGIGMGLGISQRIVKIMGGRITVESEHKKGSSFHVCIPVKRCS